MKNRQDEQIKQIEMKNQQAEQIKTCITQQVVQALDHDPRSAQTLGNISSQEWATRLYQEDCMFGSQQCLDLIKEHFKTTDPDKYEALNQLMSGING